MTTTMSRHRRIPQGRRSSYCCRATVAMVFALALAAAVTLSEVAAATTAFDLTTFDYTPKTDVSKYLKLASDIMEMRSTTVILDKQRIYEQGNHSFISLASLSLTANVSWQQVPIYNVYLAAFRELGINGEDDSDGLFDGMPVEQYADTLVKDLFDLEIERIEGTGSVVLNVLMSYWGFLWQMLQACKNNKELREINAALDIAVALWVGEGQVRGDDQKGYFLYQIAEFVGTRFGQDSTETNVNSEVLNLFVTMQTNINQKNACASPSGYITMRENVQALMRYSNRVLVQLLLHHIQDVVESDNKSDFVELVSLALNPQIAACDNELYANLTDLTVRRDVTTYSRDAAIEVVQQSLSCLGVTCDDVGAYEDGVIEACQDRDGDAAPLPAFAQYQPTADVRGLANLDRDIRAMRIFMHFGRWEAARDYYENGWNARGADNVPVTLKAIATGNVSWTASDTVKLYKSYNEAYPGFYGYGDELISDALVGTGAFVNASESERRGLVFGALQSHVMYIGVVGQLSAAIQFCDQTNQEQATRHWDSAAALLIGSTEGEFLGGQNGGQSIYAVSKEFCFAFNTCEPKGSVVGTVLLASLQAGAKAILAQECDQASTLLKEKILPFLLIPIIHGVLYYSVEAAMNSEAVDAKGFLIAYTQALLPYVQEANPDSAMPLEKAAQPTTEIVIVETFRAIRTALPKMKGVNCQLIGRLLVNNVRVGVCPNDDLPVLLAPSVPTAPTGAPSLAPVYVPPNNTGLAWGRFNFVAPEVAHNDSLFTLDVKDMYFSDTPEAARAVYLNPSKFAVAGLTDHHDEIKSLQHFSTKASLFMGEDPMYNFYRVALFDDASFDSNTTGMDGGWPYADAVEELAVGPSNGNSAQLGSKAAVVMEIWMAINHQLYEAVRKCDQKKDVPELIDSAVGLWIGQEQGEGKYNSGWSMYSIAQEAAEFYGLPEKEAQVNKNLMDDFVSAQSITKTCSSIAESATLLRPLVDKIIRRLSVPLLQHLLFHMSDNNYEYVELYALAFIPQTISVDEGAYLYLQSSLFEGFNWQITITTDFLSVLGKVLHAMRFTCGDMGDVTSANTNLQGLVTALCNEIQSTYESIYLAAYETSVDVSELARMDLDVLQVDLFMRANAYDLAFSVYQKGRNSMTDEGAFNTLKGLATNLGISSHDGLLELQREFYAITGFFADDSITAVLTNHTASPQFEDLSRRQLSETVRRTLQTMVVYMQTISQLRTAIDVCKSNTTSHQTTGNDVAFAGQNYVDQAVALYVGSIEGPFSGGSLFNTSGQMMYSLAKEMCPSFSKCETHGDAGSNVLLLFALSNMKESLDDSDCDGAESILEQSILTVLPVPIIQGILYFANLNEGESPQAKNSSLAAGVILTEALLPQLEKINKTAAELIFDNMDFDFDEDAVRDGKEAVFDAFASVLRGLGVDCNAVGTFVTGNLSVCDDAQAAPPPSTPTNLGDNLYVTTTYVQDRANIALDIKDMQEDVSLGHTGSAESVYNEGRNSKVYDKQGKEIDFRALASFSTNSSVTMKSNPVYQIAVYALRDETGKYLGTDASKFADSIVREMFVTGAASKKPLAAEAAVALNLWMELANELFQTVANCRNKNLTDVDGVHSIDEAVAYWIGDGQGTGGSVDGHLLYALAEKMGHYFNINSEGQSRTNINILRLFHQAKMEVSLSNACAENPSTARRVRRIVDKIISLMIVVNVQALIHYLLVGDEPDRVRIYAHAFVPLVAGCSPQTFKYLKEKLLDAPYREVDANNITAAIRSTFPCFGIKCDDVGIHSSEPQSACSDPSQMSALAEYKPANDVREYAKLDLDILELDILLQVRAYDAAAELYSFGKHASMGASGDGTALSLQHLATTSGRSVVPQVDTYKRYFGNDGNHADSVIQVAFTQSGGMTDIQRRVLVTGTSQYMVVYIAALQAMNEAIGTCSSSGTERGSSAAKSWDQAAALLIGHLEGTSAGGSIEGRLLWALSKKYCAEFGTCSVENVLSSKTNDKIATLLYSGRGAVLGGSCDELRKATNELAPLLLVPLLQASLSSTSTLAQRSPKDKELVQAQAYVYVSVLLPLIDDINRDAATTIRDNFPLDGQAMRDGVHTVAIAFSSVMSGLGVHCGDVGKNTEIDACTGNVNSSQKEKLILAVGIILGVLTLFGIVVLLRSRRKVVKPEDAPVFIVPKGELNHSSDIVCAFTDESGSPRGSDGETDLLNDASDAMEDDEQDEDEYVRAIERALTDERAQVV